MNPSFSLRCAPSATVSTMAAFIATEVLEILGIRGKVRNPRIDHSACLTTYGTKRLIIALLPKPLMTHSWSRSSSSWQRLATKWPTRSRIVSRRGDIQSRTLLFHASRSPTGTTPCLSVGASPRQGAECAVRNAREIGHPATLMYVLYGSRSPVVE